MTTDRREITMQVLSIRQQRSYHSKLLRNNDASTVMSIRQQRSHNSKSTRCPTATVVAATELLITAAAWW